jgi:hypothetical protein
VSTQDVPNWAPCANCPHPPEQHTAVIVKPVCIDPPARVLFEGTLGGCLEPGCTCSMYALADLAVTP